MLRQLIAVEDSSEILPKFRFPRPNAVSYNANAEFNVIFDHADAASAQSPTPQMQMFFRISLRIQNKNQKRSTLEIRVPGGISSRKLPTPVISFFCPFRGGGIDGTCSS